MQGGGGIPETLCIGFLVVSQSGFFVAKTWITDNIQKKEDLARTQITFYP